MSQENEVTMETIEGLKSRGFTHITFELKDTGNPHVATVEVLPGKGESSDLHSLSLGSREVLDYFEKPSPMARYVISPEYLSS